LIPAAPSLPAEALADALAVDLVIVLQLEPHVAFLLREAEMRSQAIIPPERLHWGGARERIYLDGKTLSLEAKEAFDRLREELKRSNARMRDIVIWEQSKSMKA
jgi:hypothetical protein